MWGPVERLVVRDRFARLTVLFQWAAEVGAGAA